ncbi:MAG: hypothetical protein LUG66_06505, partial [Clostridiales bacterium]|nr:hypothetical protein [Clostridiales bacterium]
PALTPQNKKNWLLKKKPLFKLFFAPLWGFLKTTQMGAPGRHTSPMLTHRACMPRKISLSLR